MQKMEEAKSPKSESRGHKPEAAWRMCEPAHRSTRLLV